MTVADARAELMDAVDKMVVAYMRGTRTGMDNVGERQDASAAYHNALNEFEKVAKQQGSRDENARLQEVGRKYLAEHAIESDPKEGGHA